jgi:transcription-repair coupling factor (superfamily II helicase)
MQGISSSRIADVLRSARELKEPIHVSGATPAARALLAVRFQREFGAPLVVICPSDDAASDFASDFEALSGADSPRALLFPSWEQSPYSPIAPSIRTRLLRLGVLAALRSEEDLSRTVIVTSIPAAAQATLSRATLGEHSVELKTAASVGSREELVARFIEAGYAQTDPVEDPGTIAVRGDIVDIFPPDRDRPLRVELFGDEIEVIREFDAGTQRAMAEKLDSACIPPAREVLVNSKTASGVREQVKARADDLGISRKVRDPLLASVHQGVYPDHCDAWAPFAYPDTETLWEHLSGVRHLVVWDDELTCQQSWDEFAEEQKKLSEDAARSGVIAPTFETLFRYPPERDRELRARAALFLDRFEVAGIEQVGDEALDGPAEPGGEPAPTTRHRVQVRPNTDLTQGSRHSLGDLEPRLKQWMRRKFAVVALASTQSQLERIRYLLQERDIVCTSGQPQPGLVTLELGTLSGGFRWAAEGLVILTESEILGTRHVKKQRKPRGESGSAAQDWAGLQALSDLSVGDHIVHVDHGIGRYQGLSRLSLSGAPSDFLLIEYANKDKLYLPIYRLNVIQKYVGSGESVVLDKLGSAQFAKTKEKVREAVKKLAVDLVQLYAERKIRPGVVFSPRDAEYREFEAKFPFEETPDQTQAIEHVLKDLESGKVMDRLVCGDVGYGKTEVAIRAAFRAISDGKQVAVLVPTTILAHQHEQSFKARLKDYPVRVESLSRFKSAREQKKIVEDVASGRVDIIIGTHRLLSRDIAFQDLGLVVVDEEHRFGVEHKEKLKTLKLDTHVLTLTATPIPRTLHMALSGLRDITLINTPPVDRLPIRTYVSRFDEALIQKAITFELGRGGQVFFLHNRVQTIHEVAKKVGELIPQARVIVGHGQMGEKQLEEAMVEFYEKRANVLVCTAIIESGLDVPSANTILVNRADALGLAQLYQIRGRVGRGQNRAYAYLMIPAEGAITDDAKRRLEVIQRFVELGSGFSIASHDLEIRGGGDLLGPQQSGHIAAVGFDLFTELLEEAIREIQGRPADVEDSRREPEIKGPFAAFLSEQYVPDVHQRLSLYRRLSASRTEAELLSIEEELRDRYGEIPEEAQNLMWLIRVKQLLKRAGIDSLTVGPQKVSLVPGPASQVDPARVIALVSSRPLEFQLTPDSKLVAKIPTASLRDLSFGLEALFKDLGALKVS